MSIKETLPAVVPQFVPINSLVTIDTTTLEVDVEKDYYFKFDEGYTKWQSQDEINNWVYKTINHRSRKKINLRCSHCNFIEWWS